MIDPKAFVSQSAVIGVYGEGFDTIKVKTPKELPTKGRPKENKNA